MILSQFHPAPILITSLSKIHLSVILASPSRLLKWWWWWWWGGSRGFATKILYSFLAPTFLPTNLFQNPVLFFNECNAMKAYWRSGGISPHILDLGSTWRWVVSFMPRPLYPKGKNLWYPLVGLRAGLDAGVRRKIPSPYPECFRILLRIY